MNPKNTALVLIEYQNDFVKEGGALHDGVKDVMASTDMFTLSQHLLQAAREAGVCIMHVPISFAPGYPEIPAEPYGILAGIVASAAFKKGGWGAEIVDEMKPQGYDIVIEGKRGLDCFASTNLDFILRARGITDVAIAGFLTNCCVESTMRSAYERGYQVATITDCTATLSEEEQQMAVAKDFAMFSRPMSHTAFLAALE
ncbi:isochorismatase [Polymorphobacter glacialis]|uniref:Isochorismatase n=1 Tax=Sandarakinorhabdus glacialis TaxID=1614636 RepID=A0A917A0R3_9SPHN|nr:cysteine hydrolase [Polymorphobacter glacialis]GGE20109.1 isochorismatase [Polymorphobacter glacialis]